MVRHQKLCSNLDNCREYLFHIPIVGNHHIIYPTQILIPVAKCKVEGVVFHELELNQLCNAPLITLAYE